MQKDQEKQITLKNKAKQLINSLRKNDLDELKTFKKPPIRITIIGCLMPIILKSEEPAKYENLQEQYMKFTRLRFNFYEFKENLMNYDYKQLSQQKIDSIQKILEQNQMLHDASKTYNFSRAIGGIHEWVQVILQLIKLNKQ